VKSLPKTVTQQRRDCDLNPGPSAPESSKLTTRLPSHPYVRISLINPSISAGEEVLCFADVLLKNIFSPDRSSRNLQHW